MPDFEHDPIRSLRDLAAAGRAHAHGLPGEQVRALGARRHRRRTIATVAAASLAVVVFAGGALTAAGRFVTTTTPPQPAGTEAPQVVPSPAEPSAEETPSERPGTPAPSPSAPTTPNQVVDPAGKAEPPGGWLTEIPAGFRVDGGLPAQDADVTVTGPGAAVDVPAYEVCDTVAYPTGGTPSDRLAVLAEGPEYRETRALTLYPDAATARRALQGFVTAVDSCPREGTGRGDWQQRSIVESGIGDNGYVVVQNYGRRGFGLVLGTYSSHLVRVGNALLFVEELGEGEPGSAAEVGFWADVSRHATAISHDMCVFAADPCTSEQDPATQEPPADPDPQPKPEPEPAPDPTLPRSVLLGPDQTWYHERGDFRVVSTVHGEGDGYVSVCQRDTMAALGAVEVWRRDFAFRQGDGPVIRSAALQFADERTAAAAYDRLGRWAAGCRQAVRSRGYERFSDRGRWYAPASGTGFRSGMTYGPVEGDRFGEMAYFDDQGLVLAGDRLMLVTLVVPGQDYNWAYTERDRRQTGLPMHPMFRVLPAAAANLAD